MVNCEEILLLHAERSKMFVFCLVNKNDRSYSHVENQGMHETDSVFIAIEFICFLDFHHLAICIHLFIFFLFVVVIGGSFEFSLPLLIFTVSFILACQKIGIFRRILLLIAGRQKNCVFFCTN